MDNQNLIHISSDFTNFIDKGNGLMSLNYIQTLTSGDQITIASQWIDIPGSIHAVKHYYSSSPQLKIAAFASVRTDIVASPDVGGVAYLQILNNQVRVVLNVYNGTAGTVNVNTTITYEYKFTTLEF